MQEPPAAVEFARDYSSCRGYGDMRTILKSNENPSNNPLLYYQKMNKALEDFREGDYVLWSGGDPMSAFIAGLILGERGIQKINWLRWDRRTAPSGERTRYGYYTPVELI